MSEPSTLIPADPTQQSVQRGRSRALSTSIVIPVFNEGAFIQTFLKHLRQRAPAAELIVVDGQSADNSADEATGCCDQLLVAARSRAKQLNAGARSAGGKVLWFLHADTEIPHSALEIIEKALRNRDVAGGFFRIRIPQPNFVYRLTDSFAHYLGLALRIRCGDHGFFCRREIFEKIGGFPDVGFMEDADFFRQLRRTGRVVVIPERIVVSPRRFELIGPVRLTLAFGLIGLLYFLRVPRHLLESLYRKLCCRP